MFPLKSPKSKKDNNPTAGGSSSAPPPPWVELPRDLTENILRRVGPLEILENVQYVCTTWQSVCNQPSMWRVIDIKKSYRDDDEIPDILCRLAVDLSQGELIDINIDCYFTDLLDYISERSSHLKRLRLGRCDVVPTEYLTTSIKKFPELEELHLFHLMNITAEEIEAISISCPKLKSFSFSNRGPRIPLVEIDDSYALIIAKNMPNLQHLFLIGNRLTNEGLKAIFKGCPKLESLELRKCFNIDLRGDFGKICSERIKDLKCHPFLDYDYEWDDMIYDEEDWSVSSDYDEEDWSASSDDYSD
ncbi:hypothetical protein CASFOL_014504 [Castilleja foliolosa]|uniref:F-box domain-containing protein n=1 Tax=Castilleja foliolosa TaxID=1961234 RepID=A0ABD3DS37_9LAMI